VLFGCDWPYAPDATVAYFTAMYESYVTDEALRASIDREAAVALFPRLGAVASTRS
jgi:hypothetical protein